MKLDGVLACLLRDVAGGAVGERLNGAGGLTTCCDKAAAIDQEEIRDVVRAMVPVDD